MIYLFSTQENIQFVEIKKILRENGLVPIGVRGGSEAQHIAARTVELPVVASGKAVTSQETPAEKVKVAHAAKLITAPIRSGMQIYAKESDLIILAPVSPGAELLADGNIHVYGPLRGRALAGVQGNIQARIFCRQLDAELVSIAGYYLVKEDMQNYSQQDGTMQIFLENEQIQVESI
jgi:septum site-determining protein MinC